jgi:hypothetical protein
VKASKLPTEDKIVYVSIGYIVCPKIGMFMDV